MFGMDILNILYVLTTSHNYGNCMGALFIQYKDDIIENEHRITHTVKYDNHN